jgi:hypothetical protein
VCFVGSDDDKLCYKVFQDLNNPTQGIMPPKGDDDDLSQAERDESSVTEEDEEPATTRGNCSTIMHDEPKGKASKPKPTTVQASSSIQKQAASRPTQKNAVKVESVRKSKNPELGRKSILDERPKRKEVDSSEDEATKEEEKKPPTKVKRVAANKGKGK